jgi:hypothetical protein
MERLRAAMPLRAERIEARIRDMREGKLNESRFGKRMRGEGKYWSNIKALFDLSLRRYGLADSPMRSAVRNVDDSPVKPSTDAAPRLVQLAFDFRR